MVLSTHRDTVLEKLNRLVDWELFPVDLLTQEVAIKTSLSAAATLALVSRAALANELKIRFIHGIYDTPVSD